MKKVILLSIIISLTLSGCFHKEDRQVEDASDKNVEKTQDIKKDDNVNENEQQKAKEVEEDKEDVQQQIIKEVEGTEGWRTYEKPEMNIRFKYHKDWYYDRKEEKEKKYGYNLYVVFAESPKLLDQKGQLKIELVIAETDLEGDELFSESSYFKELKDKNGVKYFLSTPNYTDEEYRNILDKMAESFEFLDEVDETSSLQSEALAKDWQTYRNEEYGFEVKYPEDWNIKKLSDSKAGFALKSPNYEPLVSGYKDSIVYNGEIYINKIKNDNNLKIIDLINNFDDTSRFWPDLYSYNELKINNNDAVLFNEVIEGKYKTKEAFIKHNKDVFTFSYLFKEKDDYIEEVFDEIVSNVKLFK